jgi:hypothetical protein
MLGIDVAQRALLVISTHPFRTGGARKHAPKIITYISYRVIISYGKCLVNHAQGEDSLSFSPSHIRARYVLAYAILCIEAIFFALEGALYGYKYSFKNDCTS